METWAIVFSVISTSIGATWVLRSKLDEIKDSLVSHAQDDAKQFSELTGRVIKLESRRRSK